MSLGARIFYLVWVEELSWAVNRRIVQLNQETDIHHNIYLFPAPAAPPQNVSGYNVSKHDIRVFWEEVPSRDVNGILLGYRVLFNDTSDEVFNQTVEFPRMNVTLGFLRPYTFYTIQVLAFTIKGDGPKSPPIIVRTEEEGEAYQGGDGKEIHVLELSTFYLLHYIILVLINTEEI